MRKVIQAMLVAMLLAGAFVLPAAAQGPDPGDIWLFPPDSTYTVTEGQSMRIKWLWIATTPGLVRMYLRAAEHTYQFFDRAQYPGGPSVLTITPEMAAPYWGPLESVPPEEFGLDCPMPRIWYSTFIYELPLDPPDALTAGEYTMEVLQWLRHPVNDGFHTCTWLDTGEPAGPTPSLYPSGDADPYYTFVQVDVLPPAP